MRRIKRFLAIATAAINRERFIRISVSHRAFSNPFRAIICIFRLNQLSERRKTVHSRPLENPTLLISVDDNCWLFAI